MEYEYVREFIRKANIKLNHNIPNIPNRLTHIGSVGNTVYTLGDLIDRVESYISFVKATFDANQEKYQNIIKILKISKEVLQNKRGAHLTKGQLKELVNLVHEIEDLYANTDQEKQRNEQIAFELMMMIEYMDSENRKRFGRKND